jgi:hypothetical protein
MQRYIQRITHVNPTTLEAVSKTVVRKVQHTTETLQNYAQHYGAINTTSINGRTKSGWPFVIENVGVCG